MQQKESKTRVYALARELNLESTDLLELCRQAGFDIKNQLSSISNEQRDALVQMAKRGGGVAVAPPPKEPPVLKQMQPIRTLQAGARPPVLSPPRGATAAPPTPAAQPEPVDEEPAAAAAPPSPQPEPAAVVPPAARTDQGPAASTPPVTATPPAVEKPQPVATVVPEPAAAVPAAPPQAPAASVAPPAAPTTAPQSRPTQPPAPPEPQARPPEPPRMPPPGAPPRTVRNLSTSQPPARPAEGGAVPRPQQTGRNRPLPRPTSTPGIKVATPPPLKARPGDEKKAPAQPPVQKKLAELSDSQKRGETTATVSELLQPLVRGPLPPGAPGQIVEEEGAEGEDESGQKKKPGAMTGRQERHAKRNERAKQRKDIAGDTAIVATRTGLQVVEIERPSRGPRRGPRVKQKQPGTLKRKGKVPIYMPITVRSLCEAIGVRSVDLLFKLKDQGISAGNLNVNLDPLVAETIALEYGAELDIKRQADAEEAVLATSQQPDSPESLVPRAPVVTIMGHVDHGKTSLLDKIRSSNIVATEAGGITQVIRAWRVEHNGKPITFLDTPGHEAFTKMRARGANVTDIAVIVVAADDGVMPQTEEAVNHARAANVALVVAINKVDLPNANLERTKRQLYQLNVLPDNMGGDTPFVETSAAKGIGIDDLLESILLVAELKELKANPNKPARGTCLEANLSEGEGVMATLLVQEGTLRTGDAVLCGGTSGKVRAMYDDHGQRILEAGPTVPVRITGLDEVPNADDPFHVVDDLTVAKEIGEKRRARQQAQAVPVRQPMRLENLREAQIQELKIILKADARGSIEAIRKELEKLHHEEVRVRILEASIGGITENDVWLALTSPEDTLVVGFNAVPDERAQALAEDRGIQLREYKIIYQLTDDVRSALEGKLKPHEEVVHLGRAVVRQLFKISRVGTIAGCYVTQGIIERSAKVRIIRDGVVVYPPADKSVGLDSLKRHKDDAREVREGYDCGLKISGYDDIKVGDVIETYRVEQVQRKLS